MTFIIQITNDHKVKIPFRDGKNIFEKVFQKKGLFQDTLDCTAGSNILTY